MSTTSRRWIGLDLGTGGARALAVDDDGVVCARAARPLRGHRDTGPDGTERHEQDPEDWLAAARGALAEVAAALDPATVAGVAVDATSGTVVLVDRDGGFRTPGVMYDDARGAAHAPRVREEGAALWDRLGVRVGTTWALPTVLAMLAESPDSCVRHQTDVVNAWLVGTSVATDAATALKTGYDVDAMCWPTELVARLGLDADSLPPVVRSGTPLGVIGPASARATGLRAGTPVLAGTTDGCAAQFGAGAVAPGAWHTVLGTTLILKGVTETPPRDPTGTVYSHRAPQGGWWLPGGASSTGAGVLSQLLEPTRFDALTARLRADPPPRVPVAYPLAGHGERFPFAAEDAHGFWLDGVDGHDARPLGDLVATVGEEAAFVALAEGVAFVERLCTEHLAALGADLSGTRSTSGGAVANRWWTERRAAALATPLDVPAVAEPALGAAVLARAGHDADGGEPDLVAAAAAMVRVADRVDPVPAAGLDERYETLVAALRERGWAS